MPHGLFCVNNAHSKNSTQDPKKGTLSHPLFFQPEDALAHLIVHIGHSAFFKVIREASWTGDLANCQVPVLIGEVSYLGSVWVRDSGSGTVGHDKVQNLSCIVLVGDK
jgi:hypothetical protein